MANKILVIGAGGQLARCIADIITEADEAIFLTHSDLDITDKDKVYNTIIGKGPMWLLTVLHM